MKDIEEFENKVERDRKEVKEDLMMIYGIITVFVLLLIFLIGLATIVW